MNEDPVSVEGLMAAAGLSLIGTVGHFLTAGPSGHRVAWIWLTVFVASWLVMAAASVNFNPKRWLR